MGEMHTSTATHFYSPSRIPLLRLRGVALFLPAHVPPSLRTKNGVSRFYGPGALNIRLSLSGRVLAGARDDPYVNRRAMLCCRELGWPTAEMEEALAEGCTELLAAVRRRSVQHKETTHPQQVLTNSTG